MGKFDLPEDEPAPKVVKLKPAQEKPRFPGVWLHEAQVDFSGRHIIKGLIEPGAFVVVYGPSGSGKSFFCADLAQCVATGQPWRGRKVERGLVVYIASEAGASIIKRFVAWRDRRLGDATGDIPLHIITRGPNLLEQKDLAKLLDHLSELAAQCDLPLQLVIFDTLSRSIPGGDENTSDDMTKVVGAADAIRERFNAAVGFVHHSGKDPDKGARGHSALYAAADLVIQVVKNGEHVATVEKVRDGVSGERYGFKLVRVEIGEDGDGDAVATCLLEPTDQIGRARRKLPGGKNIKIIWPALQRYAKDQGERTVQTSLHPAGLPVVAMDAAVERLAAELGTVDFRNRDAVRSCLTTLKGSGHVGIYAERLWILEPVDKSSET